MAQSNAILMDQVKQDADSVLMEINENDSIQGQVIEMVAHPLDSLGPWIRCV